MTVTQCNLGFGLPHEAIHATKSHHEVNKKNNLGKPVTLWLAETVGNSILGILLEVALWVTPQWFVLDLFHVKL